MNAVNAYFAGLIDGEGHIKYARRSDRPTPRAMVQVQMTDEEVVRLLKEQYGGQVCFRPRRLDHYKDVWRWRVWNNQAISCLYEIRPYLIVKARDADAVLAAVKGGP